MDIRKIAATAAAVACLAAPLCAQTVITPSNANANGWYLFDGSSGTSPATITGAQPRDGNGSLQFNVDASNQQPAAAYFFGTAIPVSTIQSLSLGYDFLTPSGEVPAASPTIRILLTGITDEPANSFAQPRSDGSLGWYLNGASGTWTTELLADNNAADAFFFRIGGVGQASLDCMSTGSSFDDRRQDLDAWGATCNGQNGTYDIQTASVTGIEVDWGTFTAPPGAVDYADLVNWNIGTANGPVSGDYNFEPDAASVTPEPATMSLLAMGLVGMGGVGLRRRNRKR